jgi:hypothetical protein
MNRLVNNHNDIAAWLGSGFSPLWGCASAAAMSSATTAIHARDAFMVEERTFFPDSLKITRSVSRRIFRRIFLRDYGKCFTDLILILHRFDYRTSHIESSATYSSVSSKIRTCLECNHPRNLSGSKTTKELDLYQACFAKLRPLCYNVDLLNIWYLIETICNLKKKNHKDVTAYRESVLTLWWSGRNFHFQKSYWPIYLKRNCKAM